MQRDDAGAQIEIFDPLQPGVFHHALQCFLIRMHAYRFGQITITIAVARDHFAKCGQHLERVDQVEAPLAVGQRGRRGAGDLQPARAGAGDRLGGGGIVDIQISPLAAGVSRQRGGNALLVFQVEAKHE